MIEEGTFDIGSPPIKHLLAIRSTRRRHLAGGITRSRAVRARSDLGAHRGRQAQPAARRQAGCARQRRGMNGTFRLLRQAWRRRRLERRSLQYDARQRREASLKLRQQLWRQDWERLRATPVARRYWQLTIGVPCRPDPPYVPSRYATRDHYGAAIVETLCQSHSGEFFIKVGPPEGAMRAPNWPDGAFAVTGEQAKAWLMADKFDRELSMENADFDENQKVLVDVFGVGDQLRAASQARPKSNDAASADAPPSEKVGGVDPNEVSG